MLKPILESGGKDISHWFDPKTRDVCVTIFEISRIIFFHTQIRKHVDPATGCLVYFCPHGRFIHVPPPYPSTEWENDFGTPWWKDDRYYVGVLSKKTRLIKIVNTLTSQEQNLEVCSEETMNEILQRYLKYNAHAASYTWKYDGVNLNMEKTLLENNIADEDEEFYKLGMRDDEFLQPILLFFNDDLTEA